MSPRLSVIELSAQAQAIRDAAESDFIAAHALYAFVDSLAKQARAVRGQLSADAYVQRGMGAWDDDMGRLQNQLAQVMAPTLGQSEGPHEADVIRPILRGEWPAWIGALPHYADGVRMGDPMLPPTAARMETGGSFKTTPVVAAVVTLWNQAFVATELDASAGDDRGSRLIKEAVTSMTTYFEGEAPGDEHRTLWSDARELFASLGEAVDDASRSPLWDGFGSGLGTALGYAAAAVGGLLLWRLLRS